MSSKKLPRYNRWLSIANIVVALFIFVSPFLPGISFWLKQRFAEPTVYSGKLADDVGKQSDKKPTENRLVVPSIFLDEVIHEGPSESTLSKGVWRRPNTATPSVASNTVLAGHVFTYSTPAVFYNLGKIKLSDRLAVYWEGAEYLYEVRDIRTVQASAIQVEAPTITAQLTLYTCTPLWNPVNRLIVTADLKEVTQL